MSTQVENLQSLCETGQRRLMEMDYLGAERILAQAESAAWDNRDFDTLSRLYMPLQEARRQRRQRCGEGVVCLDLIAEGPDDHLDPMHVIENYPHGQLLVAGWGSIEPALSVRRLQDEHNFFVETFLAASYPAGDRRIIAIIPALHTHLPSATPRAVDQLIHLLPPHSIVLSQSELPAGQRRGSPETYAQVMGLWEQLHRPFLAAAEAEHDPIRKIAAYRRAIEVDYACEIAHQHLSDVAATLAREKRKP